MSLECLTCGNTDEFYRKWTDVTAWILVSTDDEWLELEPSIGSLEDVDSDLYCEMCDSTLVVDVSEEDE